MKTLSRALCWFTLLHQVAFIILIGCKTSQQQQQSSEDFIQPLATPVTDTPQIPQQDDKQSSVFGAPGHMQPLGSHRPPEKPGVDVLDTVPDPELFFSRYVRDGRPVVFRGAAKNMAAYQLWTDEYLSEQYGQLVVEVEEGKKENRSKDLWHMPLAQFIQKYQKEDIYLVTDVPQEMSDEFGLLRCISCGSFAQFLASAVIWYSSGGTKSVLHYDSADNINCVMDGRKEIFLADKDEKAKVNIDHTDGSFSGADVERVDLTKYPGLGEVPWYNVTLEKGDCLFIPYRWFHSVYSEGRNLAVNVWFVHQLRFNASGCHDDPSTMPEFVPLSSVEIHPHNLEHLRSEIAYETLSNGGFLSLTRLAAVNYFGLEPEEGTQLFHSLDEDGDGQLSLDEVYSDRFTETCNSLGIAIGEEGEEGEDEERGDGGEGLSIGDKESRDEGMMSRESRNEPIGDGREEL